MERSQFTFYVSFAKAIRRIRKKQDRCDAYDAICDYALFGIEPDFSKISDAAAIAFDLIRPNLDSAAKKSKGGKSSGSIAQDADKIPGRYGEDIGKEKESEKEKEKEIEVENEC